MGSVPAPGTVVTAGAGGWEVWYSETRLSFSEDKRPDPRDPC